MTTPIIHQPVEIGVENVLRKDSAASVVELMDTFLEEIHLQARRLLGNRSSAEIFDEWLRAEREAFWSRQVEVIEDGGRFRVRMLLPGVCQEHLKVTVSEAGIEVVSSEHHHRVDLANPPDPGTVSAVLDRGELRLSGATLRRRSRTKVAASAP